MAQVAMRGKHLADCLSIRSGQPGTHKKGSSQYNNIQPWCLVSLEHADQVANSQERHWDLLLRPPMLQNPLLAQWRSATTGTLILCIFVLIYVMSDFWKNSGLASSRIFLFTNLEIV